jgi:transcriptional regulator with XRE-family HTH domain
MWTFLRTSANCLSESLSTLRWNEDFARCYVSRVENGHTVPAVETLEKFARALEVPMYVLFYDGDEPNSR